MTKHLRLAVVVVSILLIAILFARYDGYQPTALPGAHVQLTFEENLKNIGSGDIDGQIHEGKLQFAKSLTGQSYFALGDGGWLEFRAAAKPEFSDVVEISFDFKPENWDNPYRQGSAVKTMAVVSGRSNEKIRHVAFSISSGNQPSVSVSIENLAGHKARLNSEAGSISWSWHSVMLRVDRKTQQSSLYLDGEMISSTDIVPAVIEQGFDRIKLGTWYKKNQAYRGLIDNFIVRDLE